MTRLIASLALLLWHGTATFAADAPADAVAELTPTGRLRAAINLGNGVLAQKDTKTGALRGVSVEIAIELARRLGKDVTFVEFDAAGKVTDALKDTVYGLVFLGADPVRGAGIQFTAPYVLIEGGYIVPSRSTLQRIDDVDREGVRIAVGRGSAYDLFLTRAIKKASLVRSATSAEAPLLMLRDKLDAAAGVKVPLIAFAKSHGDVRVMDGRFMVIEQAVGTPKGRGAAAKYLATFVEDLKASGFISRSLAANRQTDAVVAPPAP